MSFSGFIIKIFDFLFSRKSLSALVYHSVSDGLTPISVSIADFKEQMYYLKNNNYKAIDLNSYLEFIGGGRKIENKEVFITFDDGFKDIYENALPILKDAGFPAVIAVNPLYVGKKAEFATRQEDKRRLICSLEELRELAENGFSIINHGYSHKEFTKLSEKEMVYEYEEAKKWIEKNIEKNSFSDVLVFPKGSKNAQVVSVLEKNRAKLMFDSRMDVYPDMSLNYFVLNLNPVFRWLRKSKNFCCNFLHI